MTLSEAVKGAQGMGMIIDEAVGVSFEMLIHADVEVASVLRLDSIRNIYLEKYILEKKRRTLVPIEDQEDTVKRHYWTEAAQYDTDRERRTDTAIILYLIDQLCQRRLDTQE
jgi:hypothetical protein